MENRVEYHTVVLSALLHDIGKFLHRGRALSFDIKGTHPEVSGQFISAFAGVFNPLTDVGLLKDLVIHHHQDKIKEVTSDRTRNLAYLVNKADILSSRERGDRIEERQDYRTTPLVPVFQRVFSSPDPKSLIRYHPFLLTDPAVLSIQSIFPHDFQSYSSGELESTIKAFGDQANSILKNIDGDFSTFTSHILALLQNYTLAIPANTQEAVPDTSLYDHLKTTSAIAACLYLAHDAYNDWEFVKREDNTPRFCLVVGDVSGIQRYVFDIAEKDRAGGGVARRLRARSLFVQLISEVAPLQILDKFDLPLMNILMSSGGKFYLLLPALPGAERKLEEYCQSAANWFLENFKGALGLNLAWVTCKESGLGKGFGETIRQVMAVLDKKKEQGFRPSIIANSKWNTAAFVLPSFGADERACRSCGKFGATETDLCPQCQDDVGWGRALPEATCVSIGLKGNGRGRNLLGANVDIGGYDVLSGHTSFGLHINNPDVRKLIKYPSSFRYLARHVPREEGQVMDFQTIAGKSRGRHYLGFLKADVDRLGEIFAFGLRGTGNDRWDTPSRIATMSRQLDLFFTGWVEHLLEKEFTDCYCVFSGGDDLFVIGPWNRILDFVSRLRDDFTRYTCGNREITLSAGAVIESSGFPVGQAAEEAGEAVEQSKNAGRNCLTVFGYTLPWDEWVNIRKLWEDLRKEDVSSAFLYSLLDYAEMWQDYKKGNVLGLRFQPLLAYNLKRNLNRKKSPAVYDWAVKLLEWRPNQGNNGIERTLDNLGLIAQLLILWKGG